MPVTASTTPNFFADTLTLQATNVGGSQLANIPITITAKGAVMRFSPTLIDFGVVALSGSPKQVFAVVNDGNAPAEVNFTIDNDNTGITASFGRTPTGTVTVAGATTNSTLSATFTASDTSLTGTATQSGRIHMIDSGNASNVYCAPLPSPLALAATEANITTSVDKTTIDFGSTDCGSQKAPQSVTINNLASTGSSITWNATITSGTAFYTLSNASGSIPPNGSVQFQVQPKPIPQTSAVTPNLYSGTVSITTSAPNDTGHVVQLSQSAQGVILQATAGTTIAFGGQSVNQTLTHQYSLTNAGNVTVSGLQISNANPVFTVNAASQTFNLDPNQTQVPIISFTPTAVQTYSDTLITTVPAGTVLCAAAPTNVTLSGTGVTGVSVSVSSLNFGFVQCQSAPPSGQAITLQNKGATLNWTPTLGRGQQNLSPYFALSTSGGAAIATGAPQLLAAGSSVTFIVTPTQINTPASTSSDAFADTLTVTTDSVGDAPHIIQLHMTAQGAFLAFSPSAIDFGDIGSGVTNIGHGINVINTGNFPAAYTLDVTMQQGNNKVMTSYPQTPGLCTQYTSSAPYSNQCAPPSSSCYGYVSVVTGASLDTPGTGIKLTVASTSGLNSGDTVIISGVQGTIEANGAWVAAVDDGTHVSLSGSTFQNAYTSGGTIVSKSINIALPEFCSTLGGGSIFSGQTQSGVLEATGYPVSGGGGNPPQAIANIKITPAAGAVLCNDPIAQIPLQTNP
jgi:hypothetical protein